MRKSLCIGLLAALVSTQIPGARAGSALVVTSSLDPGDGVCDAECTLREAIVEANSVIGQDLISFAIPGSGHTITLAAPAAGGGGLPSLTDGVKLDGLSESGGPGSIEIDGTLAGSGADGLHVEGRASILGLSIINFDGSGIVVEADAARLGQNFIGTNRDGDLGLGNGGDGIRIIGASRTKVRFNHIASNAVGLRLSGDSASENRVRFNVIGPPFGGSEGLGNVLDGVRIENGSSNNSVGARPKKGLQSGSHYADQLAKGSNLIAGNGGAGLRVVSGDGNYLRGNNVMLNDGLGIDTGEPGVSIGSDSVEPPELTGAHRSGAGGVLRGEPGTSYYVDFYRTEACDESGYGEGNRWISGARYRIRADGSRSVSNWLFTGGVLRVADGVSATATNVSTGETSEFSNCVKLRKIDMKWERSEPPEPSVLGKRLRYTATMTNHGPHEGWAAIEIEWPYRAELISATTDEGSCRTHKRSGKLRCPIDFVGVGESVNAEIVVRQTVPRPIQIRWDPIVRAFDPGNNRDRINKTEVVCTHTGTTGDDRIVGTAGDDVLCGLAGDDRLVAAGGNDILVGGLGSDDMDAGDGFDVLNFGGTWETKSIYASIPEGKARGTGRDSFRNAEGLSGSWFDDVLIGGPGPNVLVGLEGEDRLVGWGGADRFSTLDTGPDQLFGGEGRDFARADRKRDVAESVERLDRGP